MQNKKEHTLDAADKPFGRVASEAAVLLMGKDTLSFRKNIASNIKVNIVNASKIKYNPKKLKNKIYQRYSGYPGGRSECTMQELIESGGYEKIFEKAVYGMLPANRLRSVLMKNLTVTD